MSKWTLKLLSIFLTISIVVLFLVFGIHSQKNTSPVACMQKVACSNCNLLLISVDSLRADHMSSFGYERNTTPFLDFLAGKGFLFKNYFTASYLTPISEAALQTGMYPTASGVTNFDTELNNGTTTLTKVLKSQGFTTAAIHTSPEFWFFPALKDVFSPGFDSYNYVVPNGDKRDLPDLRGVEESLSGFKGKQFFMWLTIGKIHWPYYGAIGGNIYTDKNYNGILKRKDLDWDNVFGSLYNGKLYPSGTALTATDNKYIVDKYDEGIKITDSYISDLYKILNRDGLLKKTIIVIESEHGEELGEHGIYAHYDILDSEIHTPLIILSPKSLLKGQVGALTSSVDVLPTVLSLLGIAAPNQIQGKNLVPFLCGAKDTAVDAVYTERDPLWEEVPVDQTLVALRKKGVEFGTKRFKDIGIRTNDWKFILRQSSPILSKISWWVNLTGQKMNFPDADLFDIKNDPGETKNVINDHPDVAATLKSKLLEWYGAVSSGSPLIEINKNSPIQRYF